MTDTKEILRLLSENAFEEGETACEKFIDFSEKAFMEALTMDTATSFVASVLLFCQFSSKEKKPWKAIPHLFRIEGALRFMKDFASDREIFSQSIEHVASQFAYAGFFEKASYYYRLSATENDSEDSLYFAIYYALKHGGRIDKEKFIQGTEISDALYCDLLKEAKDRIQEEPKVDPVEQDESYLTIRYELEQKIDDGLKELDQNIPFCIRYWNLKKKILSEVFGISWSSPEELNPNLRFQ